MMLIKFFIVLIFSLSVTGWVQPEWWPCVGVAGPCHNFEVDKCGPKRTVAAELLTDVVDYTVKGSFFPIYERLHKDAVLEFPTLGFSILGAKNISIYLTSKINGSRNNFYTINADIGYSLNPVQEDDLVGLTINQTVPTPQGGTTLRQDEWWVRMGDDNLIRFISIRFDTFGAGALVSRNPIISEANIISCGVQLNGEHPKYYHCLGKEGRCHGYEEPCPKIPINRSLLKEVVSYLAIQNDVLRYYYNITHLLAGNSYQSLPALNVFFGGPAEILSYQLLGSPDLTDPFYIILNATIPFIVEQPGLVVAEVDSYFYAFQTGISFNVRAFWYLVFNELHQVYAYIQQPDTYAVVSHLGSSLDLNVTSVCDKIGIFCTGNNQFYPVTQQGPYYGMDCPTFMSQIPLQSPAGYGSMFGFSVGCRAFHTALAENFPNIHCVHTSALNINSTHTPCNNY